MEGFDFQSALRTADSCILYLEFYALPFAYFKRGMLFVRKEQENVNKIDLFLYQYTWNRFSCQAEADMLSSI